jgi:uncharacterized membrane protein HdeD (DUF308 family)
VLFLQSRARGVYAPVTRVDSDHMKTAGFLLLLSGLFLVLSALVLLRQPSPEALFVVLGIGVEAIGLGMVFRAHVPAKERRR